MHGDEPTCSPAHADDFQFRHDEGLLYNEVSEIALIFIYSFADSDFCRARETRGKLLCFLLRRLKNAYSSFHYVMKVISTSGNELRAPANRSCRPAAPAS